MEKEYLVLVGAAIGLLGSLLVTFINNKQKIKRVRIENEHNTHLEKLKFVTSIKKEKIHELLPKLEEAAGLVSKLSMAYSQNTSYIDVSKKISPEEYNEWYLESNKDVDRLAAIIKIHFDELSEHFGKLAQLTNLFWGNQHNLLLNNTDDDKEGYKFFLEKVTEASIEIQSVSSALLNDMSTVASRLNESLFN